MRHAGRFGAAGDARAGRPRRAGRSGSLPTSARGLASTSGARPRATVSAQPAGTGRRRSRPRRRAWPHSRTVHAGSRPPSPRCTTVRRARPPRRQGTRPGPRSSTIGRQRSVADHGPPEPAGAESAAVSRPAGHAPVRSARPRAQVGQPARPAPGGCGVRVGDEHDGDGARAGAARRAGRRSHARGRPRHRRRADEAHAGRRAGRRSTGTSCTRAGGSPTGPSRTTRVSRAQPHAEPDAQLVAVAGVALPQPRRPAVARDRRQHGPGRARARVAAAVSAASAAATCSRATASGAGVVGGVAPAPADGGAAGRRRRSATQHDRRQQREQQEGRRAREPGDAAAGDRRQQRREPLHARRARADRAGPAARSPARRHAAGCCRPVRTAIAPVDGGHSRRVDAAAADGEQRVADPYELPGHERGPRRRAARASIECCRWSSRDR